MDYNPHVFTIDQRLLVPRTSVRFASFVSSVSFASLISLLTPGVAAAAAAAENLVDLRQATIVVRPGEVPVPERTAARVLKEELQKRIGVDLPIVDSWPASRASTSGAGTTVIALASGVQASGVQASGVQASPWKVALPAGAPERRPEGYRLLVERRGGNTIVWILGADPRGALFGIGELLRA